MGHICRSGLDSNELITIVMMIASLTIPLSLLDFAEIVSTHYILIVRFSDSDLNKSMNVIKNEFNKMDHSVVNKL